MNRDLNQQKYSVGWTGHFLLGFILQGWCMAQPLTRVPNTTLTLPQQPAMRGFSFTNAFPGLQVNLPMGFATPPEETNRLFILERAGRVVVVTNLAAPTRSVFLDISSTVITPSECGLLGMAFHPGYATNRFFYLFYSLNTATAAGTGLHQRVARFQTSNENPNAALASSVTPLLDQFDQADNHNGGDIHFGPDGYLYVSLGDEGGGNDQFNNSQSITKDFHSGILRLDVDKKPENLPPNPHPASTTNYFVPLDNPFVGATNFNGNPVNPAQVRTEFWAVGLRNPWRMSFDPANGDLYCGDVGQGAREEVNLIVRGGNYGWAFREGTIAGPKTATPGFRSISPIHEYQHCSNCSATPQAGNSITGGVMYRGNRMGQLFGKYIFSDYISGHVWALAPNGTNVVPKEYLLTENSIAAFGVDPRNGDILVADLGDTFVKRLVYNDTVVGVPLPPTLADTGAFSDLTTLQPQPGIVPYEINTPFWSDGAQKTRWFSVPNPDQTITFSRNDNWFFPTGTVWIKHFELELTNGVPESRRRLETRFIVKNPGGVYGATYRWDSSTNAALVEEEGRDEIIEVRRDGAVVAQSWHYPSRAECLACHTTSSGLALGFNTAQLNRDAVYSGVTTNQLAALDHAGYFNSNVAGINLLRAMVPPTHSDSSVEIRVRSYLAANCSQCHRPGGAAPSNWDARFFTPTAETGVINGVPRDPQGDEVHRIVKPGSIDHSLLLSRISTLGALRMPPISSSVLDLQAIELLSTWITNDLANFKSYADWQVLHFGATNSVSGAPAADPDADLSPNQIEYLAGTDPTNREQRWAPALFLDTDTPQLWVNQPANRAVEIQASSSFPPSWQSLDVPGNRPHFPSINRILIVEDSDAKGTNRFYRSRIFAP
jgi:uncharacterized repeat protein (TIGR03806 family)